MHAPFEMSKEYQKVSRSVRNVHSTMDQATWMQQEFPELEANHFIDVRKVRASSIEKHADIDQELNFCSKSSLKTLQHSTVRTYPPPT